MCNFLIYKHVEVSSRARGLLFGLSLHLYPYFAYASSEDSGESAHIRTPESSLLADAISIEISCIGLECIHV